MTTSALIKLDIPADIHYLGIVTASLAELLAAQPAGSAVDLLSHNMQLAVHEICVNVIEHAYGGSGNGRLALNLTIEPRDDGRRLIVEVYDTAAHSFDPAGVAAPDLAEPQIGGYGLFLVQQLMDEVHYELRPDGHCWRLAKNLE